MYNLVMTHRGDGTRKSTDTLGRVRDRGIRWDSKNQDNKFQLGSHKVGSSADSDCEVSFAEGRQ